MKSLSQKSFRLILLLALLSIAPAVVSQPLSLKPTTAPTEVAPPTDAASIKAERTEIETKLQSIEQDLSNGRSEETEEFKSLRSSYSELLSILDIHLIALADSKRLAAAAKNTDQSLDELIAELSKDIEPNSFLELVEIEAAYIDAHEELADIKKSIQQRRNEINIQNKLADELAKQLRLERERRNSSGESLSPLLLSEIREQIARASSALRKTELEGMLSREKIADAHSSGLLAKIHKLNQNLHFTEEQLQKETSRIDTAINEVANEVAIRQKELNTELTKGASLSTENDRRVGRVYSDLLNIYLTALRSKQEFLDYKKQLLVSRYELHQGKVSEESIRKIANEIKERSSAADIEIASQNQRLANILEEFAGRHESFVKQKGFGEINDSARVVLRSTMLTLADIGKQNKLLKYFIDTGDFSVNGTRPGLEALASVQIWAGTLWNYEVFVVDDSPITVGKLLLALVIFILGIRLSRVIAFRFLRQLLSGKHIDAGARAAVETVSFYVLVVLWAVISLQFVKIPLTIFTLAGGALAIGVGFGSQTIVKNFFNGLILLLERPIKVGDIIQYDTVFGTVSRIGTRSTVIITPDQLEVIVPNSYLIENVVTNWTLSSSNMRRKVTVGVAYGSPLRETTQILLEQAKKHNLVLKDPEPDVLFSQFGDSSLDFVLRFWVHVGFGYDPLKVESDLRHMIDGALRDAGIVIAFPQRDTNLTQAQPLKIQIVNGPSELPNNEAIKGKTV